MAADVFTCYRCGHEFESLPPPAETRKDDPIPMCGDCIEKGMDDITAEPLSEEQIQRIVSRMRLDDSAQRRRKFYKDLGDLVGRAILDGLPESYLRKTLQRADKALAGAQQKVDGVTSTDK